MNIYVEHADAILSVVFSSVDSNFLISGSRDQSLHIWNIDENTQSPDQPIISPIIDDEEEIMSNNSNKKRHNKSRPNRAEREKKRAAKQTNPIMNERKFYEKQIKKKISLFILVNSLAFRLLWPSSTDRQSITGKLILYLFLLTIHLFI